jgi:hypothetical protein
VDPHHFDADPYQDLTYHFDADPDPDLNLMRILIRVWLVTLLRL